MANERAGVGEKIVSVLVHNANLLHVCKLALRAVAVHTRPRAASSRAGVMGTAHEVRPKDEERRSVLPMSV